VAACLGVGVIFKFLGVKFNVRRPQKRDKGLISENLLSACEQKEFIGLCQEFSV
jgi:hypothetical protein